MPDKKTIDPAVKEIMDKAKADGIITAFERAETTKACPIGHSGSCCKHCHMGPCRITGKTTVGICGATIDTVVARNLARQIAAGTAAHSDHGRGMTQTLKAAATGEAPDFKIKDEKKLAVVAEYLGIKTEGRSKEEIAADAADAALGNFGSLKDELDCIKRAPKPRQDLWRKLGVVPRGVDREVVETLHRTTMGVDQDMEHIMMHAVRTALADGWGGSMLSTDFSDILFGTPSPVASRSNFGVLSEDQVSELGEEDAGIDNINPLGNIVQSIDDELESLEKRRARLLYIRNLAMNASVKALDELDRKKRQVMHFILNQGSTTIE